MRRSAVRTFERAGMPRSAVSIVGNKTECRYAIVDEAMQPEAVVRLNAFTLATPVGKTAGAVEIPVAETARTPKGGRKSA